MANSTFKIVEILENGPSAENLSARLKELTNDNLQIGAEAAFTGHCRSENNVLQALDIEHYPQMALKKLSQIVEQATQKYACQGIGLQHRVGRVPCGQAIVCVVALSKHRTDALNAVSFIMDFLKTDAPFWKKEILLDGSQNWVSAKQSDEAAKAKWQTAENEERI